MEVTTVNKNFFHSFNNQMHPVLRISFSFVDPSRNLNTEGYSWDQACSTGPLMLSDQDPDENFIFPKVSTNRKTKIRWGKVRAIIKWWMLVRQNR
ncbi:hypothetical protein LIER_36414 [Lithospermum erythrorhizon]|uniref:Uncharacterized protein n=1 Tax=Lithospermum erythrorhizon TaxID=34254 RepID=A0AAV3P880_LITER